MKLKSLILRAVLGTAGAWAGACALPASAASAAPPSPSTASGVHMSVVFFPSDPPGQIQEAPGGGRILLPGVIYTPPGGDNPYGPAILILDQGPGTHPLEPGQATRFAAERLAARGYTVMSLYSGQERGFALTPFEQTAYGVQGALDYLEMSGHEHIAIIGQGYGAIVAANYLATLPDELRDNGGEKRVKAVVLLNPLTELRKYPGAQLDGPDYDAVVARAEASVASGRGKYPSGHTLQPGHGPGDQYDPWMMAGAYVAPPEGFLNYWGPKAAERNARALTKLAVPVLALAGDRDPEVSIDKLRALKTASTVEVKAYAGGDPYFSGQQDKVVADIEQWLVAQGLGQKPRVRTQALTITTEGGRALQGVLYTPEAACAKGNARRVRNTSGSTSGNTSGNMAVNTFAACTGADPKRPAVMLLHGRTADNLYASTHWMGWRIAQQGYVVFVPGLRISGTSGFETSSLQEINEDMAHWVDYAATLGYKRVVLGGHSNGGIWLSNYISASHDPRVVGTIYFAPTRDSPTFARDEVGAQAYAEQVKTAEAAVARGDGLRQMINLLTAKAFLDNNGPKSRAMHTQRVSEFTLPGLSITGAKDPLMAESFVEEFGRAYKGPLKAIRYANGSHGLRENKDRVAQDVREWLDKTYR